MAQAKVSTRADEFIAALSKALTEATDIEQLFAIWERNVDTVRAINKQTNRSTPRGVIAHNLVAHLKSRAIALAKQNVEPTSDALQATKPIQKSTRVSSPLASPSVFAQRNTFALSPSSHVSSAVAPRPTHIMFAMRNREGFP